jgi:hypothetical protein
MFDACLLSASVGKATAPKPLIEKNQTTTDSFMPSTLRRRRNNPGSKQKSKKWQLDEVTSGFGSRGDFRFLALSKYKVPGRALHVSVCRSGRVNISAITLRGRDEEKEETSRVWLGPSAN